MERHDGRFIAMGPDPWLGVEGLAIESLAGRWAELTYRASLWDEPARPVFRFWLDGGAFVDRIAAGPVVGAGLWTGRIPSSTRRISVSPTNRPGPFDFVIESVRSRWWPALLAEGFRWRRKSTRSAVLTRLIGWGPESDVNLAWATGPIPMGAYDAWREKRQRPIDLARLDRPRFDWAAAPPIRLVVTAGHDDGDAVHSTIATLKAQVFPHWIAVILGAGFADADSRIVIDSRDAVVEGFRRDVDAALTGVLEAGDLLPPNALAYLAEQAHRHPACQLFYGDALHRGAYPMLKPGWSPRLQRARPYLDRPVFTRDVKMWTPDERQHFLATRGVPDTIIAALATDQVKPLRRFMVETKAPAIEASPSVVVARPDATAVIVIPTRDQPVLLRRVIASIRSKSPPERYKIVIVDNGSVEAETKALLAELRQSPDTVRIDHPGAFNFSRMCNEGASAASGDVLVFLNDDTEILSNGWLDRMIALAMEPTTGAVGAKLTYPDGRLQHVGVLVGMGESAGHFGALAPGDDPGWAGRNLAIHEVSAITGACLAVAREKFDAVGGFDAVHLPIELSDVDLCLKLNERGWQTIVDPAVHLLHEESVSRGGATLRRLDVYGSQRSIFIERWRHVLRDDPIFHPGLSLYSWQAALG